MAGVEIPKCVCLGAMARAAPQNQFTATQCVISACVSRRAEEKGASEREGDATHRQLVGPRHLSSLVSVIINNFSSFLYILYGIYCKIYGYL